MALGRTQRTWARVMSGLAESSAGPLGPRCPISVTAPTDGSHGADPRQSAQRGISVRAPTRFPYIKERQGKAQPRAAFDKPSPLASAPQRKRERGT